MEKNLDPIQRLTLMPKQMPITVMVMVTVTMGTLMVTDHTIMERGALMRNLMVTTAIHTDTDMVILTIVVIMVILLANAALMLTPMLMLMFTVSDPFMVTVTTHTQPVTMVTTWASVALKNNLDLILNPMPMVTIPATMVDGDTVDTVDTADITGAKLTDQTTSLFS